MFEIQSHRHVYTVDFVDDFAQRLTTVIRPGDCAIVDTSVSRAHPGVLEALGDTRVIEFSAREESKTFRALPTMIESICSEPFTKTSRLIAVGGGVTQDVTGFVSSILFRGTDWLFFPTTLLAQCDSCIGSKTSINFGRIKNQLGTFYPPSEIHISARFLETLPEREIMSGIGEMLHYFLVDSEEAFLRIETSFEEATLPGAGLAALIKASLQIKAHMVSVDEFDSGPRNVFNYGHSFGHAIESATSYAIPHGVAVCYGMDLANLLSVERSLIGMALRNRIRETLAKVWRGIPLPEKFDREAFDRALRQDKKNTGDVRNVILTEGIGRMRKTPLANDSRTQERIHNFFLKQLYSRSL